MRIAALMLLIVAVSGCGNLTPEDPPLMGANEMQVRPGLFSGPDGEFVIVGSPTAPPNQVTEEDPGAGA